MNEPLPMAVVIALVVVWVFLLTNIDFVEVFFLAFPKLGKLLKILINIILSIMAIFVTILLILYLIVILR